MISLKDILYLIPFFILVTNIPEYISVLKSIIYVVIIISYFTDFQSARVANKAFGDKLFFIDMVTCLNYSIFFILLNRLNEINHLVIFPWVFIFIIYITWNLLILFDKKSDIETKKFLMFFSFFELFIVIFCFYQLLYIYTGVQLTIATSTSIYLLSFLHILILLSWVVITHVFAKR